MRFHISQFSFDVPWVLVWLFQAYDFSNLESWFCSQTSSQTSSQTGSQTGSQTRS